MENLPLDQPQSNLAKADKWKRFAAIFIDYIIFSVLVNIVYFFLKGSFGFNFAALIASIYLLLKDSLFDGRSIGKKFFNIKVVKTIDNSSIAGDFGKSSLRNLSLLLMIVDPILVLIDKDRLGDGWAETKVIEG